MTTQSSPESVSPRLTLPRDQPPKTSNHSVIGVLKHAKPAEKSPAPSSSAPVKLHGWRPVISRVTLPAGQMQTLSNQTKPCSSPEASPANNHRLLPDLRRAAGTQSPNCLRRFLFFKPPVALNPARIAAVYGAGQKDCICCLHPTSSRSSQARPFPLPAKLTISSP